MHSSNANISAESANNSVNVLKVDENKSKEGRIEENDDTSNNKNDQNQVQTNASSQIVSYFVLEGCSTLDDTPFATKTELTADYQESRITSVSDELYGSANNLIKTTINTQRKNPWEKDNEEDGVQNGWLVKRHEAKAFVTIKLGVPGKISGVNIDTTGYTQCAPRTASIVGHLRNSPGHWTKILPEVLIRPNSLNYFEVTCEDIYSHIHVTTTPGGGITRIRCFGDVEMPIIAFDKSINLASSKHGAQIIQKPRNILKRDLPNLILSRAESSHDGWITPRDNSIGNRQEYTIIKLAHEGTIEGIVIDTKHFIGNAPKSVIVEGCSMVDQIANHKPFRHAYWVDLINEPDGIPHNIYPNMFHVLPCTYLGPITHVRVRPVPDGGIQQILVKGKLFFRDDKKLPIVQYGTSSTSNKRKKAHDHDERIRKRPTRQSERLKARSARSAA